MLGTAREVARDIASNTAPLAVMHSKRLLWDSWDLTAGQVEARETEDHHELMAHPDAREGVVAFAEQRRPQWEGRLPAR